MLYDFALYISLTIFGVGLLYKISGWFLFNIDSHTQTITMPSSSRLSTAFKGIYATITGPKLITVIKTFFNDVVIQKRILDQDGLRWLMHILIFAGFMFLFFFHALDRIIVTSLFDPYYLTVNPFLVIAGLMVLAGIGIAVYRRHILKVPRLKTAAQDRYALVIIAVIILSGMTMELFKLSSFQHYQKLWNIHIYACLFGLAYLPFSKLFHIFTTPISLMCNAVMDKRSDHANIRTRQIMELDACTRCGTCSNRCSVAAAFDSIGNTNILPSERMDFLKRYAANRRIGKKGLDAIAQGIYLCTNCDRCTVACPAGINLKDLWFDVREMMIRRGDAIHLIMTPFSYFRGLNKPLIAPDQYETPITLTLEQISAPYPMVKNIDAPIEMSSAGQAFKDSIPMTGSAGTYAFCFACENCSTVCPVVGSFENPQAELDLLPHQIMRSMGFGIRDLALGSKMLWYCLTCYQCQEHCPQGVNVTDILFELKNQSVKKAG